MFFDWKIQLEKVQLTRDLIYQEIRLPCKNDQGHCDSTTKTRATIVWFLGDTCTTFQDARIHARLSKFHQKIFNESIPHDKVNTQKTRQINNCYNNINNLENKLTRFQISPETELGCKYNTPLN